MSEASSQDTRSKYEITLYFVYSKSSQLENEIQKTTPFTITSQNEILRNKFSKTQATPLY